MSKKNDILKHCNQHGRITSHREFKKRRRTVLSCLECRKEASARWYANLTAEYKNKRQKVYKEKLGKGYVNGLVRRQFGKDVDPHTLEQIANLKRIVVQIKRKVANIKKPAQDNWYGINSHSARRKKTAELENLVDKFWKF